MATAITYQSGPRKRDLRTVILDEARSSVVLLPAGRLDVMVGKLLHGTACRHSQWAEWLGTEPGSDDFAVPSAAVVQVRQMQIAVRARHK